MGQSQSTPGHREISTEQLSHELALRFASKCYSHLEITHFKDNFKTLADHQDGVEYWKEDTLCRFFCLPEQLHVDSVMYQMCTYLGAFPFPSLAPCILTREAMLKVVTIMTGRSRRVLKQGDQDRTKLLFRSLAVFDRRASSAREEGSASTQSLRNLDERKDQSGLAEVQSHAPGFSIDEPLNDDEEEDDDDLALAALEALDAIEVFKFDEQKDKKIHHAQIPREHLRQLIMLLLVIAPLGPQENLVKFTRKTDNNFTKQLGKSADCILQAFGSSTADPGVRYRDFIKASMFSLPNLFEPLNPLFEHFMFSKNIDLTKQRDVPIRKAPIDMDKPPMIVASQGHQNVLTETILAQISTFLNIETEPLARSNAQLHQLYSTASDGTSLTSFSRQVSSWKSSTLLILKGTNNAHGHGSPVVIGAYLPEHWSESSSKATPSSGDTKPVLFQLAPRHTVFLANTYNSSIPVSYFSSKTGIALGCVISKASHSSKLVALPAMGPVSLLIDSDITTAVFQHDAEGGVGAFLTDPALEILQKKDPIGYPKKIKFEIDTLEVWGMNMSNASGENEATKQKKRLAWEEAEAARRRGVNFGGDKDGARALLEMAGLVGDEAHGRHGGSA